MQTNRLRRFPSHLTNSLHCLSRPARSLAARLLLASLLVCGNATLSKSCTSPKYPFFSIFFPAVALLTYPARSLLSLLSPVLSKAYSACLLRPHLLVGANAARAKSCIRSKKYSYFSIPFRSHVFHGFPRTSSIAHTVGVPSSAPSPPSSGASHRAPYRSARHVRQHGDDVTTRWAAPIQNDALTAHASRTSERPCQQRITKST